MWGPGDEDGDGLDLKMKYSSYHLSLCASQVLMPLQINLLIIDNTMLLKMLNTHTEYINCLSVPADITSMYLHFVFLDVC